MAPPVISAAPAAEFRSDGQRRLVALGLSLRDVARKLGCSHESVRRWAHGERPAAEMRRRLEIEFSLPAVAWERRADAPAAPAHRDPPWFGAACEALDFSVLGVQHLSRGLIAASGDAAALVAFDEHEEELRRTYAPHWEAAERAERALEDVVRAREG